MKRFILAAVFVISAAATYAEDTGELAPCDELGDFAEDIMTIRQMGGSLSELMKAIDYEPVSFIILWAYELPRYRTEANQKDAVIDFRNEVETQCYTGRRDP